MNKEKNASQDTGQTSYSCCSNAQVPEDYALRDGFICKGGMPVSLAASGIIEAAAQGFLHVEETEEYKTG